MNPEKSPTLNPAEILGMQKDLRAFVDTHPEFSEDKFSDDELHEAAVRVLASASKHADEPRDDFFRKALEARKSARGAAEGKIPAINPHNDAVIGLADSPEQAKQIFRGDNEDRQAA
ncbi:MAG: hypothetical protein ACREGR_00985 [Minisyncoccia bacterium]